MSQRHALEPVGLALVAQLCEDFAAEVTIVRLQEYRVRSERADRKATVECLLSVFDTSLVLAELLERTAAMHQA